MNPAQLFAAVGETEERFLAESEHPSKKRRWRRPLAVAACLALLLAGAVQTLLRLEYLTAGCGAWPGDIVDGVYYYRVPHKGFCRYTPEEGSELLVHTILEDGCIVNEYGVYYTRGRSLYVRVHATGKTEKLYTVPLFTVSHIGVSFLAEGTLDLTVYNKWKEYKYDLELDGKTGEVLSTLLPPTDYGEDVLRPTEQSYLVGERRIEKVKVSREETDAVAAQYGLTFHDRLCDLTENGVSLLPEGAYTSDYSDTQLGDYLLVQYFFPETLETEGDHALLLLPEGGSVELPNTYISAAAEGYVYCMAYSDSGEQENAISCLEIASGESWTLPLDHPELASDLYDFATDGTLLYSSAPWAKAQTCWEIVRDESGRPASLRLVAEDISEGMR
ncbi:MAG: hypothetical protein ACI3W8_07470 [Oscillospiraceae bacterium]